MRFIFGASRLSRSFSLNRCAVAFILIFSLVLLGVSNTTASNERVGKKSSGQVQVAGSRSRDNVWSRIDASALSVRSEQISPQSYQVVELNESALAEKLSQAPFEFTRRARRARASLTLPMPDGTFQSFAIEESPSMEPELAAQFPEIKSYRGQGIDDPTATARFDWSSLGFHAVVLNATSSIYVDPYSAGDTHHYISYDVHDMQSATNNAARCEVTEEMQALMSQQLAREPLAAAPVGSSLRTYRLALATTQEYTNNSTYGGGQTATLTKLNTIVNLINAIYEREAAIHFNLVAGELSIIFTAEPDGYTNGAFDTMLGENPGVLNANLSGGSAAYDIGHVLGLGNPGSSIGIARLSVVCGSSADKGKGSSVLGIALVTGTFSIDSNLVAHEFGHQLSAMHTFNSTASSCNGNRASTDAYEPGGGSTIMAYPGVCPPENLQQNSDNYFHASSFDHIANFAAGAASACAVATSTGNSPPTVSAGPDYTIPVGTPFTLTASGSDPNGDTLTYTWEEMDLGVASPPMTDDGTRPLFRSFAGTTNPSRTFPRLSSILNGTSSISETLPSTTRAMNFRVTARDNRASGGGVNSDSMVLNVTSTAGPFAVTSPNTAVSWSGGSSQTVTWSVANTNVAPVSCANVKISMSTDGGNTFPLTLAASTPNDGSQVISVPNVSTSGARVKVEGVGNVFFDISNANFSVTPSVAGNGSETIGLYNPATSTFFLRNSNTSAPADVVFGYGPAGAGWIPVAGDWNGDGIDTIGLYNPATSFFFLRNANSTAPADLTFSYGPAGAGWIPISGDWNGDGVDTIGLYNPATSTFFLRNSNTSGPADIVFSYGPAGAGWLPVVGDWNADNVDTIGLYNPATSTFFLRNSNSSAPADLTFAYGPAGAGWIPIAGDWNNDGMDTIGLYNPATSTFFLRNSNSSAPADLTFAYGPAGAGWKPIVGDWDGL